MSFSVVFISNGDTDGRVGGEFDYAGISSSEGRVVIPGTLPLVATTSARSLAINDRDNGYWFDLPLKFKPDSSDMTWTDWWPKPGQTASNDVNGTNGFQIRYRIVPVPPGSLETP